MTPGWRTSELTLAGFAGIAIFQLALRPIATVGQGIATAGACLALGWIAGRYAYSRAEVKRK